MEFLLERKSTNLKPENNYLFNDYKTYKIVSII